MWKLSADTGGTFTDILAEGPGGEIRRGKVLSSGCLRTVVEKVEEDGSPIIQPIESCSPEWLVGKHIRVDGVAVATIVGVVGDKLQLSHPGAKLRAGEILEIDSGLEAPVLAAQLVAPEALSSGHPLGFRIGTTKGTNALLEHKGARVALFLSEGFQDLLLIRDQKRPELFAKDVRRAPPLYEHVFGIRGRLDTDGDELIPLDAEKLSDCASLALRSGCDVAAICLLNSWSNPQHELQAIQVISKAGFTIVSASSQVRPLIKYLDRTETTLVNATLSPVLDAYLDQVEEGIGGNPLWIMTSAGGLVSRERFHPVDSLVSGPAGGLLGAVEAGRRAGFDKIIGLDMGGTSADVSRWKERLELRQQIQVGQARILTPAMPIETVAAGGGSICGYKNGRLFVGPESAGASPGPASYGAGGPLCLTDIHLLLGRIDPAGFSIPIRLEDARKRLEEVMAAAGESDWEALAEGFLTIATERMAHAIRQVTLRDGEDPAEYGMVAFGGAGGLHACRVADELGIQRVLFPRDAGILSARGIHFAPLETVREQQVFWSLSEAIANLSTAFQDLEKQALEEMTVDGVGRNRLDDPVKTVYLRIRGQESGIGVQWSDQCKLEDLFRERFVSIFGYYPNDPELEVVKIRLRLLERRPKPDPEEFDTVRAKPGPNVISDPFSTCFVESGWEAVTGSSGSHELRRSVQQPARASSQLKNVEKTLVMNRLEGLVEEMGDQLRRTALSTNIRERLDFSCALLDSAGRLLVNAPHIPVHLGAMGLCVRECIKRMELGPGDVIITNHPAYGGSHLPDVTLVRGLFDDLGRLAGYIANRAHHAEWGGRTPGSMPADARNLAEEGVIIKPIFLIRNGKNQFPFIEQLLSTGTYPSRAVRENRIDLEAQLAALVRGHQMFDVLLADYGFDSVTGYFEEFYAAGATAIRRVLEQSKAMRGHAVELMDDGARIEVDIQSHEGGLCIDFNGTSPTHCGNLNATPAIVRSAVLYVLRMLVDTPIPLNEGLLDRVEINLPGCFLNPSFPDDPDLCPAVVGGNVETSQRVVDSLIRALGVMAAGQGTMNNFLFGNDKFGYYETIGGGAGAGKEFPGASGTHVHMTNTAITDPEILEQRFPVICREFSIRKKSGGKGLYPGGNGLVREILFRQSVEVSMLSQNREKGARGISGGKDGLAGRQWHLLSDGSKEPIGGICQLKLCPGESIRIETPGGGGYGPVPGSGAG